MQFMEKYYEEFLRVVDAKEIAKLLHVRNVIDPDLLYYIEKGGPKASVEELFIHLQYRADADAIRKVCHVLLAMTSPSMRELGQKMLNDEDLPPGVGMSFKHTCSVCIYYYI